MTTLLFSAEVSQLPLPRVPTELVDRPEVLKKLSEKHAITVLCAPPGFGKTTAVARWFDTVFPTDPNEKDTRATWIDGARIDHESAVKLLSNLRDTLDTANTEILLVIDGYDRYADHEWDRELLDLVRAYRKLRVILTSRDPQRHKGWNAADLDIEIIDTNHLRFTQIETHELIEKIDARWSANSSEIHTAVWGWPILVRAVARAEGRLEAAVDCLREIPASKSLADEIRKFAYATAHAIHLSPDKAMYLTGDEDVMRMLDRLMAVGLLQRLENGQASELYHYLPVFRDVVFTRLGKEEATDRWRDLSRWCHERGDGGEAIHYAVKAEDWDFVVNLVMHYRGDVASSKLALEALESIKPDTAAEYPVIGAILDVMAGPEGRVGDVPVVVNDLEDATPQEFLAQVGTEAGFLRFNGQYRAAESGFARVEEFITQLQPQERSEIEPLLPMVRLQSALVFLMTDQLDRCAAVMDDTYRVSRKHKLLVEGRNSAGVLALISIFAGDGVRAARWLTAVEEFDHRGEFFEDMVDTCADSARALFELGRLNLEAAKEAVDRLNDPTALDEMWPFIVYAKSDYALLTGNPTLGLRALESAVAVHGKHVQPGTITLPLIAAARANLLLMQGEGNRALMALENVDQTHPVIRAALARIELSRGENQRAIVLAHTASRLDNAHDRALRELRLIRAVAHLRAGDTDEAVRIFRHFIADQGVGVLRALALMDRRAIQKLIELSGVGEDKFQTVQERVSQEPFMSQVAVVSLTPRESLVLELLNEGLTNLQISEQLVVSTNTVKSQVRSLYRKLDVNSRADALKRAAAYGLLAPKN